MVMRLKIQRGILLTQEQVEEIASSVMSPGDIGVWGLDSQGKPIVTPEMNPKVYEETLHGEHGKYHYRVNLSWEIITILSVE